MNRWKCATITITLYVSALLAIYVPLGVVCFIYYDKGKLSIGKGFRLTTESFLYWQFWLIVAVIVIAQFLMLFVPIRDDGADIKFKERRIWAPIITAGFLMAILVAGFLVSIGAALFGDDIGFIVKKPWASLEMALLAAVWVFWILFFRRHWKTSKVSKNFTNKTSKFLLKGSILEWLVAVSCHIVVRWRGDCSAPFLTFYGIMAGVAVAFLSFGPGLFYYFLARRNRMMP